jgi:hypothetical protein
MATVASKKKPLGKPLWQVFEEEEQRMAKENTPKCPHCGAEGEPTNRYLLRCTQYAECGRYFS